MSESILKNNLSQYLDVVKYFKYKQQGDKQNQIRVLNQVISLLQSLINVVPFHEKKEYLNRLENTTRVRNDLIQAMNSQSSLHLSTSVASQISESSMFENKRESFIDRDLTLNEKEILKNSSSFNGSECVVWLERDATDFDQTVFNDPFDFLLTTEQIQKGYHFEHPTAVFHAPTVVDWPLNPFNIRQQRIGDCTIISSIISCANYEMRFKKPLITGIIYPQVNGRPVYNPYGKYYVKLWFNGIPRRVVIDHRVMVSSDHRPISSYSKVDGELWSILIEKAFLKVHGGYSYSGGNGGQDTYSITGWIPESLSTKDEPKERIMEIWNRVSKAFNCGDCIVTAGTFNNLSAEGIQLGLSEGHCYCVCRMENVDGNCLLQIRNPWGCSSWKGAYSYRDVVHWTPRLRAFCPDYEYRVNHPEYDDGLFWMDYSDFIKYFGGFNVNWSTSLLSQSITYHDRYCNFTHGLVKDSRDMSDCPQYSVEVENKSSYPCPVYIILSRHYNYYEDLFGTEKRKFLICLQAYKTSKPYYMVKRTEETEPVDDELLFTNIPYSLVKIRVPPGRHFYTVVVLTMKENEANLNPFNFSVSIRYPDMLKVLMVPMFSVPDYHFMTRVGGGWVQQNSGGRPSQKTYLNNPAYSFSLNAPSTVHIHLQTNSSSQAINLRLIHQEDYEAREVNKNRMIADSGAYMENACGLEVSLLQGKYCVIPSAFDTGFVGDYSLTVRSTHPVELKEFNTVYRPVLGIAEGYNNSYNLNGFLVSSSTGYSVFERNSFANALFCRLYVREITQIMMKMTASLGCRPVIAVFSSVGGDRPESLNEQSAVAMSNKKENTSVTGLIHTLFPGHYYLYYGFANSQSGEIQLKIYSDKPLQFFYFVFSNK